jgi:hypothetical protein
MARIAVAKSSPLSRFSHHSSRATTQNICFCTTTKASRYTRDGSVVGPEGVLEQKINRGFELHAGYWLAFGGWDLFWEMDMTFLM